MALKNMEHMQRDVATFGDLKEAQCSWRTKRGSEGGQKGGQVRIVQGLQVV